MARALLAFALALPLLLALGSFLLQRADEVRVAPLVRTTTSPDPPLQEAAYARSTILLPTSSGETLEAWLYMPRQPAHGQDMDSGGADAGPASQHASKCLIMAHGMGGQRDFGLHPYAHAFASEGFAVLVFDYRCFSGSSGEPRNLISPRMHVEDWVDAIRALQPGGSVSTSAGLSCSSLALWGSSFSGGHVLVAAAQLAQEVPIKAIVSQVPHLNGLEATKASLRLRGLPATVRLVLAGLYDAARARLGLPAAYVRLVGPHGSVSFMQLTQEEERKYHSKHPAVKMGGWIPWAPARLVLEISRYSPVKSLPQLSCPILFLVASQDTLCPPEAVHKAVAGCSNCELREFDVDHFSLYGGQVFKDATREMVTFLKKHC